MLKIREKYETDKSRIETIKCSLYTNEKYLSYIKNNYLEFCI